MSMVENLKAGYAAFGRNDPSVLFGAMDPAIEWIQAEGNPLADRNPYIGGQAIAEGVFARLMPAVDHFTVTPNEYIDGGDQVVVLGRYAGIAKNSGAKFDMQFCHVWWLKGDKIVKFQQFTNTALWAQVLR